MNLADDRHGERWLHRLDGQRYLARSGPSGSNDVRDRRLDIHRLAVLPLLRGYDLTVDQTQARFLHGDVDVLEGLLELLLEKVAIEPKDERILLPLANLDRQRLEQIPTTKLDRATIPG